MLLIRKSYHEKVWTQEEFQVATIPILYKTFIYSNTHKPSVHVRLSKESYDLWFSSDIIKR